MMVHELFSSIPVQTTVNHIPITQFKNQLCGRYAAQLFEYPKLDNELSQLKEFQITLLTTTLWVETGPVENNSMSGPLRVNHR